MPISRPLRIKKQSNIYCLWMRRMTPLKEVGHAEAIAFAQNVRLAFHSNCGILVCTLHGAFLQHSKANIMTRSKHFSLHCSLQRIQLLSFRFLITHSVLCDLFFHDYLPCTLKQATITASFIWSSTIKILLNSQELILHLKVVFYSRSVFHWKKNYFNSSIQVAIHYVTDAV